MKPASKLHCIRGGCAVLYEHRQAHRARAAERAARAAGGKKMRLHNMNATVNDRYSQHSVLVSYESEVVSVEPWAVVFGGQYDYSNSTKRQINAFFNDFWSVFPELATAAGRRAAIERGKTYKRNGDPMDVLFDCNLQIRRMDLTTSDDAPSADDMEG